MTAVELLNIALHKLGESRQVASTSELSQSAMSGELHYNHLLRKALRRFPWPFATKYARPLTLTQGRVWDDEALVQQWTNAQVYAIGDVVQYTDEEFYYAVQAHTAATGTNEPGDTDYWTTDRDELPALYREFAVGDWDYAYRWPTDCIFARRLVPPGGHGRIHNETPIPWREGRDRNGLLIYAHEPDAVLEYTTIDCFNLWADDLFLDYFTWVLAAALAPSTTRVAELTKFSLEMAEATLNIAAALASREQQHEAPGPASWISAR